MATHHLPSMPLDVGICDIDSYDMLFYSNYVRYNERAANQCLSPAAAAQEASVFNMAAGDEAKSAPQLYAVLAEVHMLKYTKSVRWTDEVEIRTTDNTSPVRMDRMVRPIQLHERVARVGTQPAHSMKLRDREVESHVDELGDRPGRQAVAACLFARILLLLHEHDGEAVASKPMGGCGAPWSAADDQNVGMSRHGGAA